MTTLFAWATPAWFNNAVLDHTWVTTYDNRIKPYPDIAAVVAADEEYWLCWGSFHVKAGTPVLPTGDLCSRAGSLALAKCLVAPNIPCPNNPPAQGTIFAYGVDGVCHQLANQVLYATHSKGIAPLLVSNARGYAFSSAVYGDYGRQHAAWNAKRSGCDDPAFAQAPAPTQVNWIEEVVPMAIPRDDFERRAQEVLAGEPKRLARLLQMRASFQSFAASDLPQTGAPSAASINARNQRFLDQAAEILGAPRFERLFGFHIGQKVDLVDPEIMRQQQLLQQ